MSKTTQPDLKAIKPSARRRTALIHESTSSTKRTRHFTSAASILDTENPGLLQPENNLERTFHVRQSHLHASVDQSTRAKANFRLDLGHSNLTPYIHAVYSRSSRSLLITSAKGHVSVMNWRQATLQTELFLNETVRDATFLHSDAFFALSQRKYVYIYDSSGAQLHVLRNHREPGVLRFLPHHLLLASASTREAPHRRICYTDTSTGEVAAELDFGGRALKLGNAVDGCINHANGVLNLAHVGGVVTMWSPIASRPLAQVFTHAGGVRNVAVFNEGLSMVTTGADCMLKVWDLRTYKMRASWRIPAITSAVTVSQRGLIATAFGATVQIWAPGDERDRFVEVRNGWGVKPYMTEMYAGHKVHGLDFCPFEDFMAVCHGEGMDTMVVPGAGEATFDSRAPNPYETRKQRRENEVRVLLDKLPKESIVLDIQSIGGVEKDPEARLKEIRERSQKANEEKRKKSLEKKRAKGRNKISKRLKRKQANIIDAKKVALQEKLEQERRTKEAAKRIKEKEKEEAEAGIRRGAVGSMALPEALSRFLPKK